MGDTNHTPTGDMASEEAPADSQERVTLPLTHIEICWRIVIWIITLLIIVVNVVVDIITLILYLESDEYTLFAFTLVFLAVPLLVIAAASLTWLRDEDRRAEETRRAEDGQFTVTSVLLHVMLLGLVHRYGRLIMKAPFMRAQGALIKSWERDAHLLMLIQTTLHCCSQLVLQLYIIADDNNDSTYIPVTILCTVVNFIAITWSVFIYILYDMFKTSHIKLTNKVIIFTWHLCIIISRVLAFSFFTVAFDAFVFIPFALHWTTCSVVVFFMSTDFCSDLTAQPHKRRHYLELPFDAVIGYVLLFFYYNTKKGRTLYAIVLYHVITFIETLVLSVTFYVEKPDEWYSLLVLCLSILLFLIGATLILLYYLMLHPKTKCFATWNLSRHVPHHNGSSARISKERQESNEL